MLASGKMNFLTLVQGWFSSCELVPGVNTRGLLNLVVSGLGLACWYRDSRLSPVFRTLFLHQHLAQLRKVTFGQQEMAITVPGWASIDFPRAEATKGHV